MKSQRITLTKRINKSGTLYLDTPDLQEFCRQHPDRAVIVRVELLPIEPSQKSLSYYWKVVVPTIQRGLYDTGVNYSISQTDKFIRSNMPVTLEETWEDGHVKTRVRTLDELDTAEINELIEQLKIYAAENLYVYIEEPERI